MKLKWPRRRKKAERKRKLEESERIDEFLFYYRQYRPKQDAFPLGWNLKNQIGDGDSFDSGRFSELTQDEHFFKHFQDEADSGVSSFLPFKEDEEPEIYWDASLHSELPLPVEEKKAPNYYYWILAFSVVLVLFLVKFERQSLKRGPFDWENLENASKNAVIGQDLALDKLFNFLKKDHDQVQVAVLFGSEGTGKSLVVDLLQKFFQFPQNIATGNLHKFKPDNLDPWLVILEDFKNPHHLELSKLKSTNAKVFLIVTTRFWSRQINQKLLWSKIQNRQIHSEDLQPAAEFPHFMVPFLPLTREQVAKCAYQSAQQLNLSLFQDELKWILNRIEFFSHSFPIFSSKGCQPINKALQVLKAAKGIA